MKRWLKKNAFRALWVAAVLTAVYGYREWRADPYLLGTVVSTGRSVGAREGGTIEEVSTAVGERVAAGQVLARLDASDLLAEKRLREEELAALESIVAADRRRFSVEYDLLRLRVSEQYAAVQAEEAELEALSREIDALVAAEKAGLGHDRDLTRMTIRRDALAQSVAEQSALIRPDVLKLGAGDSGAFGDSIMISLLGDRVQRIHEVRQSLTLIDQRLEYRTVRSPCSGSVSGILALQGSTVEAFAPIVTVEGTDASEVEVYVRETEDKPLAVGQEVEVMSRRSSEFDAMGRIDFVHPGYSPMPERLWLRGQMLWARKARVLLEPGHLLLPGESVRVRVVDRPSSPRGALAEEGPPETRSPGQ